jgi:hypothetical protein
LFDVENALRPDPDTPAPVRFLPEYDNVLLSHADRSRFASGDGGWLAAAGPFKGSVLIDGTMAAIWRSEVDRRTKQATIVIEHRRLSRTATSRLESEARRVARFWPAGAAGGGVRLVELGS